jgi:hypothetical protein
MTSLSLNFKWPRFLKDRKREKAIGRAVEDQLIACIRTGVNDDFQRGYVCALYWSWKSAGYPDTAASIAAEALVTGGISSAERNTP